MALKMIGAPSRRALPNGGEAREATYLYTGADPSASDSGVPWFGDSVDFISPKVSDNGIELTAKVVDRNVQYIGGGAEGTESANWMVYVTAAHEDTPDIRIPASPDRMEQQVRKDYARKVVYLDPAWWGIVTADRRMAGMEPFKSTTSGQLETEWYYNMLNIDGERAREGDFVFKNAGVGGLRKREINKGTNPPTWGDVVVVHEPKHESSGATIPVKGETDPRLSPYGPESYGPTDDNADAAGTRAIVYVYTVTYFERGDDYGKFVDWSGISPGPGSFPKRCAPGYNSEEPNFWLAIDQRFAPASDTLGDRWVQITRVMESAPPSARWNPDKSITGEWSW